MGSSGGKIIKGFDGRLRVDYKSGRLVVVDTNNKPIAFLGLDDNGDVKVKLAQADNNVFDASDDKLIFSSDFNLFKIVDSGTTSVTVPVGHTAGNIYTTNVAHSLGYAPLVIAFSNRPNATGAYNLLPYWVSSYNSGTARWEQLYGIEVSSSSVDLTFVVSTNNISAIEGDWEIRYYIVQETAQ